jgi:hypothetical protein
MFIIPSSVRVPHVVCFPKHHFPHDVYAIIAVANTSILLLTIIIIIII